MLYTVRVRLDARESIASKMAEMREWLDRKQLTPEGFQYRMEPDAVTVRADFKSSADAAAFTEAFGERLR
jgi:hypothetical protein